jgi:hypothetical protein
LALADTHAFTASLSENMKITLFEASSVRIRNYAFVLHRATPPNQPATQQYFSLKKSASSTFSQSDQPKRTG